MSQRGSSKEDRPSANKRRRLDASSPPVAETETPAEAAAGDDKEEDVEDIANLLNGDDFITEEERQEREAQRRRLLRKQRLERAAAQQEPEPGPPPSNRSKPLSDADPVAKTSSKSINENGSRILSAETTTEKYEPSDDDDDDFDMFSSSVSPVTEPTKTAATDVAAINGSQRGQQQQDWDDAEGYYKAVIGEVINIDMSPTESSTSASKSSAGSMSFRVSGVIGKGVFSTVCKCTTVSNSTSTAVPPVIALKLIRHNETMAKSAAAEVRYLQRLEGASGIVPLLLPTGATPIEHRGHVLMVFNFMEYNLRDVLHKYGKGVGLSLQAVQNYFGQLLAAATHLKKHGIIHADLKPDNILVSSDFGTVQLADFGSALDAAEERLPTPYLVSRFYRAPEIILGLIPTFGVDLWSLAVSVAELFLGDVLFRGTSNNDMLYVFMQHLGPFSNRVIRQHLVQCQKMPIPRQFQQQEQGANYVFTQQTVDPVTGSVVYKNLSLRSNNSASPKFPLATPLTQKLLKAKSGKDSRILVLRFADLLIKCLALDATRRIALKDALRHEFFVPPTTNAQTTGTASNNK